MLVVAGADAAGLSPVAADAALFLGLVSATSASNPNGFVGSTAVTTAELPLSAVVSAAAAEASIAVAAVAAAVEKLGGEGERRVEDAEDNATGITEVVVIEVPDHAPAAVASAVRAAAGVRVGVGEGVGVEVEGAVEAAAAPSFCNRALPTTGPLGDAMPSATGVPVT